MTGKQQQIALPGHACSSTRRKSHETLVSTGVTGFDHSGSGSPLTVSATTHLCALPVRLDRINHLILVIRRAAVQERKELKTIIAHFWGREKSAEVVMR
jgi:hypothetical protein